MSLGKNLRRDYDNVNVNHPNQKLSLSLRVNSWSLILAVIITQVIITKVQIVIIKDRGPLSFYCNRYDNTSFAYTTSEETKVRNGQSQVSIITSQNLILKSVKPCSLNLISLIDISSQKTLFKKVQPTNKKKLWN